MKRSLLIITGLLAVMSAGLDASNGALAAAAEKDNLSPETRRELGQVRRATAKYLDIFEAIADGYVDINVFVPGQGFHYLKPAFLDETFIAEKPEILVYAIDPAKNRLRLVAVEYAIPTNLAPTPPEAFTGTSDVWDLNEEFALWTLHCWLWLENPNGMFAEFSPRVP